MNVFVIAALMLPLIIYSIWVWVLKSKAREKSAVAKAQECQEWDVDFLESKRKVADPIADKLIADIMQERQSETLNHFFHVLQGNEEKVPPHVLPVIKEYFDATSALPEWADEHMLRFGQRIYLQHGLLVGMLLFYKSLPECYSGVKGATVLLKSARLNERFGSQEHFARRLAETGLFIYDAMMPNALDHKGKGIRAAQKIRLIHATIRFFIKKDGWDTEAFGEPINQEDMAGTLMSFSALVLEGLNTLGVRFDDTEMESYIHCWRVVGHLMGVDADMIPVNAKDALKLGHAIIDHQKGAGEAGESLTGALLIFCQHKAPGFISKDFHAKMMRYLMGEEISALLRIPHVETEKLRLFKNMVLTYIRVREFLEKILILALPIAMIDRLLLKLSVLYLSKNKIVNFYLPKSLRMDFLDKK